MYELFSPGMLFPRPEDEPRLLRYRQARLIFDGKHGDIEEAKRIADKLRAGREFNHYRGMNAEGVVYLVYNLARLVAEKFADLQVLQAPLITLEDKSREDELKERLRDDVPELWYRMHEAITLKRVYGDVLLSSSVAPGGTVDVRVIEPSRWYPVLDPADELNVTAHQIAWIEPKEIETRTIDYLRVDTCFPDRVERKAYLLKEKTAEDEHGQLIDREATPEEMGAYWPGLTPVMTSDLGGLFSCVHIPNGYLRAGQIFGRPQFIDSGGLIDDVNWRLSCWSDANDRVSHAPELIPEEWLDQDEHGTVAPPSQYARRFIGAKGRTADSTDPQYMQYPLEHTTLKEQFEASLIAFLIRHEMSPGLLGLQFGKERESGEAKSLGMGTTEAATRRDLMQTQPLVDQLLTATARMIGFRGVDVSTHWRVGLPKTQQQLMQELQQKKMLGLVTRRDMLETLYPWFTPEQIDEKLAELGEEREQEAQEFENNSPFGAKQE